jgi:hypothetical protein
MTPLTPFGADRRVRAFGAFGCGAGRDADLLDNHGFGNPTDAWAKVAMIAIDVPAMATANETYHKALSVTALLIVCAYVGALFARI